MNLGCATTGIPPARQIDTRAVAACPLAGVAAESEV
jgi:hypothetical protein